MKYFLYFFISIFTLFGLTRCKTQKAITKAIAPRDSTKNAQITTASDSVIQINFAKEILQKNTINYNSFSAKIKLDIEDGEGKKPDLVANVKMIKDSVVWISITAPLLLNTEVFRVFITKDSVTLIDKKERTIHYRSIEYLQELTNIPFDLKTIQDLIVGNPIFLNTEKMAIKTTEKFLIIATLTNEFKNLVTISLADNLIQHSKLDDLNILQNRTADFSYDNYAINNGVPFSTIRQIFVTEKNKLDVRMNFKQYEFNKELSILYSVPKNYKKK
ncbi:MAG: DUF4292 domain-containing protein [Ferruginibacter sp.]|nr:DUF4292 domain-containing protein [Ferruginibacter sp.]